MITTIKISKSYTEKVGYKINLLNEISINVNSNEFLSILAPAGSGKTTLLKILSGLDTPSDGEINSDYNKSIYIPSKPSSFPWLSVFENIKFNSRKNEADLLKIVDMVGLHGYEDHFPHKKSEGFRFRISLGRAIANGPDIIIIDEPFNNLNTATREEIYLLLRNLHQELAIPIILGTTNISEAIFLSDRIYLMKKNPGEIIEEIKTPLPSGRDIRIMQNDIFINIRSEIENKFYKIAGRQLYNFSL